MREYRKRNCDKLKPYERERSARRRSVKVEVKGFDQNNKPIEMAVELRFKAAKVTPIRCMASFCKETGTACEVFGSIVYLCKKHLKEQAISPL